MKMTAVIDSTGLYRYTLWREWSSQADCIGFVMLNPSTADSTTNDPTIRRCMSFAQTWGYGSLEVVNLFAYRATHPTALTKVADPIGVENDGYLRTLGDRTRMIILAWGNWGQLHQRDQAVLRLLWANPSNSTKTYCLGITQQGQPRHPLYLPSQVSPSLFSGSYIKDILPIR